MSEDDSGLGIKVHEDAYRDLERERDEWKAKYIQQNKALGCEMMDPAGTIWDYASGLQRENVQLKREVDRERALANEAIATWRKTKEERDEALEYADKLAQGLPEGMLPKDVEVLREANLGLASELTAVTEQRDRLADQIEANHKGTLMLERMVYQSREQRDRLAEEIENLKASGIHTCHDQCKRPMCAMRRQRDRLAEALERVLEYQGRFAEEDPESIAAEALAAVEGGGHE